MDTPDDSNILRADFGAKPEGGATEAQFYAFTAPDNTKLRKARNWIARWRAAGGGFAVAFDAADASISVTLQRKVDPDPETAAAQAKAALALELELSANDETHHTVTSLVRASWIQQNQARRPANDEDGSPEPPQAA